VDSGDAGELRAHLRPDRHAVLTTDTSNITVAAILTQPDDEGHQHPVAYVSSKLTAAKQNYTAHGLELLAVVHALRAFWHYLLGGGASTSGLFV
jgi:hypothetical protein